MSRNSILKIVGLTLLGLYLLYCVLPQLVSFPAMDEAYFLLQGRWMAEGMLPYKDFFTFITPGCLLLAEGLFRLAGGTHLLLVRLLVGLTVLLKLGCFWRLLKPYVSRWWLWGFLLWQVTLSIPYWVFNHHLFSGAMALLAATAALTGKTRRAMVLSGVATVACGFFTQSLGALTALAFLTAMLFKTEPFHQPKNRWAWLIGFLAAALTAAAWLQWHQLWPHFWRDAVQWVCSGAYQQASQAGYFATAMLEASRVANVLYGLLTVKNPSVVSFLGVASSSIWLGTLWLLASAGLLGVLLGWLKALGPKQQRGLWWLLALAGTVSTLSYSTSMHIFFSAPLTMALSVVVVYRLVASVPKFLNMSVSALLLAGLALSVVHPLYLSTIQYRFKQSVGAYTALKGPVWYLTSGDDRAYPQFRAILAFCKKAYLQKESVFLRYELPAYLLATPAQSATTYVILRPFYTPHTQQLHSVQQLTQNKPLYVISDELFPDLSANDDRFSRYTRLQRTFVEQDAWLAKHYRLLPLNNRMAPYKLYQRVEPSK